MKLRTTVPLAAGTQETKMRQNFPSSFARSGMWLLSLALLGSCQPVDSNASSDLETAKKNNRPENFTPMTTIEPTDPDIRLITEEDTDAGVLPSAVTTDPCVKTKQDKDQILSAYCGSCHDKGQTQSPQGIPPFGFLLEENTLISTTVPRQNDTPQPFVMPGSPAQSLLYIRVASGTMPPATTMLGGKKYPAPSISDVAVLAEWITHCAPGAPAGGTPPAGTGGSGPGATGTGGASGSGGANGTGGRTGTGTGGAMGTGSDAGAAGGTTVVVDGGATDPDAGVIAACGGGVANNGACMGQPPCRLANQTCTCTMGGAGRRWVCR